MNNFVKLGTLLKLQHGFAFKTENYVPSSEYRLITLGNFNENNSFKYNDEKATYYGSEFPQDYILDEGDLIMPLTEQVIGLFGNSAFVPKIENKFFVLNQRVARVICDESKLDKNFAHYLLSTESVRKQLEARASGTKQRNISPSDVYDVLVDVPSLDVQKKIGDLLQLFELKIINNNRLSTQLESIAKEIYDYWFIQFDFPDENGKPYKTSGGKMVYNEELKREIPEGWKVVHSSDLCQTTTGKEDANFATADGKYAYFTCGSDILKCDEYKFDGKSILIAGNGDFNVKYYDGKFNAYQRTYVLQPQEKYVGLLYRNALNKIASFKKGSNGSIVKFITKGDIDNIQILIPNNEKIMSYFNTNLDMIQHIKNENQKLIELRDFLLPMLMNGQITFKDDDNNK